MAEPYLSEVRIFGFNFPPRGWAQCDGALLQISQNQSLYSLLGTMYGGDGRTTFGLPDLRGRTPLHFSNGFPQGNKGGEATHSLTTGEMPAHNHTLAATTAADNTGEPDGSTLVGEGQNNEFAAANPAATVDMDSRSLTAVGQGQGHQNMQPYQALNFCIALRGIFPSRN